MIYSSRYHMMSTALLPSLSVLSTLAMILSLAILWNEAAEGAEIEHWQTTSGARVYYLNAPDIPIIDLRVVFDAGSARDDTQPGLATFTNAMLEEGVGEGAKALDADAIAEQFAAVGAIFSTDARRDMSIITLRSLVEPPQLEPALALMGQLIAEPSFPVDALERVRNQIVVGLRHAEQEPGTIASKALYQTLYGDHPYASPPSGTIESVTSLSAADLRRFHRRYYVARNAVVAIIGAIDRVHAERIAERVVGGLPAGEAAPLPPPVKELAKAQTVAIQHPSTQTHILASQAGVSRTDPDYFTLYVANHILGGSGLVSRISDEVREQRGLAYSAYSYFLPMRRRGPFIMGLQTRNDQSREALGVLRKTLQHFVDEGPTAEELRAAQANITGGIALDIDSNREMVGYLAMIGFYRLPLDYIDRFPVHINAVTRKQVREVFRRRIDPQRMVTVTVGGSG